MATTAEHYAAAEMYAEGVAGDDDLDNATIRVYLDLAQIHATLALVPATVADEAGAGADSHVRTAARGPGWPGPALSSSPPSPAESNAETKIPA